MSEPKILPARAAQYQLQVPMRAAPPRIWSGLTDQINAWWLPDFHVLGEGSVVSLEPVAGGLFVERRGEASLLWFTVIEATPHQSLSLAGYCTPRWGGPCSTLISFELEPRGGETILTLTDALFGYVSDGQIASLSQGWGQLLNDGLKKFADGV